MESGLSSALIARGKNRHSLRSVNHDNTYMIHYIVLFRLFPLAGNCVATLGTIDSASRLHRTR